MWDQVEICTTVCMALSLSVLGFRCTSLPVLENNGHLVDKLSLPPATIEHLDEKGIALEENLVQGDRLGHGPAIRPEAGGGVSCVQAQHRAG
jgi:hypothetical protein